ncbi:glycosyltransferase [Naasia sp. SYSU D00948]|uniref:glycosyltransferase n=1 Tax=Naasia sp. SYSU D00948 TaxID=2817379 RepID=UPI001B31485A|nr:glycosyltransferase [Naasia sp. SYSU D00948]
MRIAAVVVSYNRSALLREALAALEAQTRPLDAIVIVDNASTDDSVAVARELAPEADLVELARNTGGAGGFAVGLSRAMNRHGADLVWLMDDDTVPTPTALEELLAARQRYGQDVALLASRVVWVNGADHPMNTPRPRPLLRRADRDRARHAEAVSVRSASFVSCLVDTLAVRESGLPTADYFIWNDDFEFTAKLLRRTTGLYCPRSIVVHKTKALASTDADPGDRFYFEVRNKIWLFRHSRPFGPRDAALYGVSTVLRWARTFAKSSGRRTLWDGLRRGVRDGLRTPPRPNSTALADLGDDVVRDLAAVAASGS